VLKLRNASLFFIVIAKKPARCFYTTCRERRTVLTQHAKWPPHTDTLALSTSSGHECVDVVMQQVDGGLQADALHRVEWQKACAFAVGVRLLQGAVIFQHPFHDS
jgi:hypothetical protein